MPVSKEDKKKYHADYYQKHKKELQEKNKIWSQNNIDIVNSYYVKYRNNHRDEINKRNSLWRKNNTEKTREQTRSWRLRNPEKAKLAVHRRRAKRIGATGKCGISDWRIILSITGNKCIYPGCAQNKNLTQDHIKPLSIGGTNHPTNYQPLCGHHNYTKNSKYIDYRTKQQIKKIMAAFQLTMFNN